MRLSEKPKAFNGIEGSDVQPFYEVVKALLQDARNLLPYRDADYFRDLDLLERRSVCEGISFYTSTLPNLASGLLNLLETNRANFPNFALKRKKGKTLRYPCFLSGLFSLIGNSDGETETNAVKVIYQIGASFKKLKGPYSVDVLHDFVKEFVAVDNSLPTICGEPELMIMSHARKYIEQLFRPVISDPDVFYSGIIPRPGPGATNTKVEHPYRFQPNRVYKQLDDVFPWYEWFYATPWEQYIAVGGFLDIYRNQIQAPSSRFAFVEKTRSKPRGICIEENEMQYMQQGVKHFLYEWIENHPLTKGRINFSDQSVNANLALTSSYSRSNATIDMSEASDRISRDLVLELFQDIPCIREALDALSTRRIQFPVNLGVEDLMSRKFAPMGSGLCFPVMSLVHWALIRAILYLSMHNDEVLDEVYVYGDDIVLPSSVSQAVFDWLPRFGMKLNKNKSFVTGFFRESCGVHAYKGVDITPVYFKYTPNTVENAAVAQSVIQNECDLFNKGFTHTAHLLRVWNPLPYVLASSPILGWKRLSPPSMCCHESDTKNTFGCKVRWNEDYMIWEVYATVIQTKSDVEDLPWDEAPALLRRYVVSSNDHSPHRRDLYTVYKQRWTPMHHIFCGPYEFNYTVCKSFKDLSKQCTYFHLIT